MRDRAPGRLQYRTASGVIAGLRIGTWSLLVELFEDEAAIGRATETVEIRRGATAKVTLQLSLATGELEIIVSWESGGVILEFDLNEPAMAEYDIASVHYTLTHGASGEIKEGDVVPEDDIAYVEVPELWSGTWQVEIELWEPDGLEPIALTDTTLDVDPGTMTELSLEYTQLYPLEIEIFRPAGPIQLYGWPDLRPAYLNGPYTAAAGEEIGGAVSVDIVNDGIGVAPASAADGTITVGFYLSPTSHRGPLSVSIGATDVASPIEADSGDSVPVPANLSIPEETPDGDYYLIAAVDDDQEVSELTEVNNTTSVPIVVETIEGISGESVVHVQPALGITITLTFVSETPIELVGANWDWTGGSVWLDVDDAYSMAPLQNIGVDSVVFYWGDPPVTEVPAEDVQTFGYYPTGFDSGDLYEFSAELDVGTAEFHTGYPSYENLEGGTVTVQFEDGTVLQGVFDTPVADEPWSAQASFATGF